MRFSKQIGNIATFVLAAVLVYGIGTVMLWFWPMWSMMSGMMGFGPGSVLLLAAGALVVGAFVVVGSRNQKHNASDEAEATCPQCRASVEPDYILCPECHTSLSKRCSECRRPLKGHWTRCPRCGVDVEPDPATRPLGPAAAPTNGRLERYEKSGA